MCIYIYVYMYIYIYLWNDTRTHIHTHIFIYKCICVCVSFFLGARLKHPLIVSIALGRASAPQGSGQPGWRLQSESLSDHSHHARCEDGAMSGDQRAWWRMMDIPEIIESPTSCTKFLKGNSHFCIADRSRLLHFASESKALCLVPLVSLRHLW